MAKKAAEKKEQTCVLTEEEQQEITDILTRLLKTRLHIYLQSNYGINTLIEEELVDDFMKFLQERLDNCLNRLKNVTDIDKFVVKFPPVALTELLFQEFLLWRASPEERFFGINYIDMKYANDKDKKRLKELYKKIKNKPSFAAEMYEGVLTSI